MDCYFSYWSLEQKPNGTIFFTTNLFLKKDYLLKLTEFDIGYSVFTATRWLPNQKLLEIIAHKPKRENNFEITYILTFIQFFLQL